MALKVVSSYAPRKLKVISSYTPTKLVVSSSSGTGATYNPQKASNVAPKTYNPQKTATVSTLRKPVATDWAKQQAISMRKAEDARIAREQIKRRRLADAQANEVSTNQKGFRDKLLDKVSFGALRRQRGGRELAIQYHGENEKIWGGQILARQRRYETEGARLKDWVMQAYKERNESEYNKRLKYANSWLNKEYKDLTSDIKDYQNTQIELANYAQTPLKGKLADIGRFTKDFTSGIVGQSWNTLTWTASQPQRAVNTVKNLVNPNNQRLYYGGDEKKGGIKGGGWFNTVKKAYNESKDQRIVGFSKEEEAKQLEDIRKGTTARWGTNQTGIKGFFRNQELDKARVKYGDDVVDMLLDPMVYFSSSVEKAKNVSRIDKIYEMLGKNKTLSKMVVGGEFAKEWAKNSKGGKILSKLNQEWLSRGQKTSNTVSSLISDLSDTRSKFKDAKDATYNRYKGLMQEKNKVKSGFLRKQADYASRLENRRIVFKREAEKISEDFVKRLEDFNNNEVRAITKFARNGEWGTFDKLRIDKVKRAELEKFLGDYQNKARALAKSEGLTRTAKNYLPEFTGRGYDPTASRSVFGKRYLGQTKQQLQESIIMRDFVSNFDESSGYLKELASTEKSILRNAKKTSRGLTDFEKWQLELIAERKQQLERISSKYTKQFDLIRGAIQRTKNDAKPMLDFKRGQVRTNFTRQGLKNSVSDIYHAPMKIWKKSVLKFNPAWYVNNTLWNVPASVSAGGFDVFNEYKKLLLDKRYLYEVRKRLPEGVASKISEEIGGGALASKIEDTSRIATFLSLKKQGLSDELALKQVNRWLFDYKTKNWERPIKGLLPFWNWQKNLIKLSTTMPFTNPRSAKFYSGMYNQLYKRPYDQLPTETQEYIDPETGEKTTFDPRKFYKGKAKIGKNWYGLPFFAVNPETMLQFGVNPYVSTAQDYLTSKDRLGNTNADRKAWTILGERYPQVNLGRSIANRNNKDINTWFASTGNSKWAQGWDKSKSNYQQGLDNNRKFYNALKSFVGLPRGVKFDKQEYDLKKRLTDFNNEFFAIDWAKKEDADYKKAQLEKEKLASKYGFDLKKDIYDNYWSKYDTPQTSRTKVQKQEASQFSSDFWKGYYKLPKGSKAQASKRRPYVLNKFDTWANTNEFATNGYKKIPDIDPFELQRDENASLERRKLGKIKRQRYLEYQKAQKTGDWSWFEKNGRSSIKKSSPYQFKGKYFKSKETMNRYKRGFLWKEYFQLDSLQEKQDFLNKHSEIKLFEQPKTQEEWDRARELLRKRRKEKLDTIDGFVASRKRFAKKAESSLRSSFGFSRRIKYKF